MSKPLRNPRLVIVTLTEHLTGRFDVQWLAELVVLTCLRCHGSLIFSARMHISAIIAGAGRHEGHCHPSHAPRP